MNPYTEPALFSADYFAEQNYFDDLKGTYTGCSSCERAFSAESKIDCIKRAGAERSACEKACNKGTFFRPFRRRRCKNACRDTYRDTVDACNSIEDKTPPPDTYSESPTSKFTGNIGAAPTATPESGNKKILPIILIIVVVIIIAVVSVIMIKKFKK